MVRWLCTLAMVIGLVASSSGQDRSPPPKGPGPSFQLATAVEKDGLIVVRYSQPVQATKTVQVEKDGKKVTQNVAYTVWNDIEFKVDGKSVAVLGADGKAIDPKNLLKRLAKPTPIAIFAFNPKDELTPDPFYLRVLREDIVVFAASYMEFRPPPPPKK